MKWISIKESLPKAEQYVLVFNKIDLSPSHPGISIAFLDMFAEGDFVWYEPNYSGYNKLDRYTHWMPLPGVPEIKEK